MVVDNYLLLISNIILILTCMLRQWPGEGEHRLCSPCTETRSSVWRQWPFSCHLVKGSQFHLYALCMHMRPGKWGRSQHMHVTNQHALGSLGDIVPTAFLVGQSRVLKLGDQDGCGRWLQRSWSGGHTDRVWQRVGKWRRGGLRAKPPWSLQPTSLW